jgi:tocopherol O-methyltransferase
MNVILAKLTSIAKYKMFTKKEIAEYYNVTQSHYEKWWNLNNSLSLHYGIWGKGINSFEESLVNTNRTMMELGNINESDKILDAGCGVGGAAMFLCYNKNVEVIGITLSEKQVNFASRIAKEKKLDSKVSFHVMDYNQTSYEDESFDVVWACESVSSATEKLLFIKEAFRILKKGGRVILSDFFLSKDDQVDKNSWLNKWAGTWGISNFVSVEFFIENLENHGFFVKGNHDFTDEVYRSAKRLYYASLIGALPSELYNLFNPKSSKFAKGHYKCGYYQYKALMEGLWKYHIIYAEKPAL